MSLGRLWFAHATLWLILVPLSNKCQLLLPLVVMSVRRRLISQPEKRKFSQPSISLTVEVRGFKADCASFWTPGWSTNILIHSSFPIREMIFFSNVFFELKIGRSLHTYCKLQNGIIIGKWKIFPHTLQHTPHPQPLLESYEIIILD